MASPRVASGRRAGLCGHERPGTTDAAVGTEACIKPGLHFLVTINEAARISPLSSTARGSGGRLTTVADRHFPLRGRKVSTGYQRSSRDAYIQRLKARRLVAIEGRGLVRASEELFS